MTTEEQPLGFSEQDDIVTLRMTKYDYSLLLIALGAYSARQLDRGQLRPALELVNRINHGNPAYVPYKTKEFQ